MDKRRQDGRAAEVLAADYLRLQGITVLRRNVACAGVEVDVLGREAACLLLVEVKLRRRHAGFEAVQSLGAQQVRRYRRAAAWLMMRCDWAESVRIDVIGLSWEPVEHRLVIEHLRGVG